MAWAPCQNCGHQVCTNDILRLHKIAGRPSRPSVQKEKRIERRNERERERKKKDEIIAVLSPNRNRLENNTEHWNALLLSLRELIEWVIRKDTELTGLGPIRADLSTLIKQQVRWSTSFIQEQNKKKKKKRSKERKDKRNPFNI